MCGPIKCRIAALGCSWAGEGAYPTFLFLNITEKIELVGDVDQFCRLDLAVACVDPGLKAAAGQFRVTVQGPADGVDDEVEKVSLIPGIAVRSGKDYPVGAARRDQPGAGLLEASRRVGARCGCCLRAGLGRGGCPWCGDTGLRSRRPGPDRWGAQGWWLRQN